MNKRLAEIAFRRKGLLEKIESQRMEVSEISRQWQKPLAVVDVGVKVVQFMYHYRALVAGGLAALLAWRRNGIVSLAQKGWRMLFLYPSALTFGLNILSSTIRSPSNKP